jgi:hypothetical protein
VDLEELQQLLRDLMQSVQLVMQSDEEMSDEFQGAVAETLNNLYTRIEEARGTQQPEQPPQGAPPTQPPTPAVTGITHVSNDAYLLWVLSGSQSQAFISYLRTFPTPATQELLNNPQQLNAAIELLSNRIPQFDQPEVDGIPHADLQSSNIWGANYDQSSGKMKVRFQGGSEYEYDGVPQNIFNAFIKGNASAKTKGKNQYGEWWEGKNPSMGAAMNQYIKAGGFPYRKLR